MRNLKGISEKSELYLLKWIEMDEGKRYLPYKDTKGNLTIGIGHNLSVPLSERAVRIILEDDLFDAEKELMANLPAYFVLDDIRKCVLLNMIFNLGANEFYRFNKMIKSLNAKNYEGAAKEILDSKAARDLPSRYHRLAKAMETGNWPTS